MALWNKKRKPTQSYVLEPKSKALPGPEVTISLPPPREDNPSENPRVIAMKAYEEAVRLHNEQIKGVS